MTVLEKVTVFITRPTDTGWAVLLLRHPYGGLQFPAGTVEPGEMPLAAARREATEETGLTDLTLRGTLGISDDALPDTARGVFAEAPIYARPDATSFNWAYLPRGIRVNRLSETNGFVQVQYLEYDRWPDPTEISMEITGWTPAQHLTRHMRRYFYWFEATADSPPDWTQFIDSHEFRLFWADPDQLDDIAPPQNEWADRLLGAIDEGY